MSKFKVGDKVRCISTGYYELITLGKEYVVVEARGSDYIWISCDDGDIVPYETDRFELVESSQKPADLPKYVIVQGKAQDVVAEVEQYLNQGYKPQGGVSMHQGWFAQAMILGD